MIEVELPDGSIAEFPDGTDHQVIQGALQKQFAPKARTDVDVSGLARIKRGLGDPIVAGRQMLAHAMPDSLMAMRNDAINKMSASPALKKILDSEDIRAETADQYSARLAQGEKDYQASRQADGQDGIDWARLGGNVAMTAPLAAAAPLGGTGLAAQAGNAALQGGLAGALQPVYGDGDFASNKLKQAGLGAVTGAALAPVSRGLGKMFSPSTSDDVSRLVKEGVTPTPGQVLGGKWASAEEKLSSLPLVGDAIRSGQRRAIGEMNAAAINRSLAPIGDKLPKGMVGREAIKYAGEKLGQAYDDVLNRMGAITPDAQFADDIASLSGLVKNLPDEQIGQFNRIIKNEIAGRIDDAGVMTSESMKAAESQLGQMARNYLESKSYDQRQLGTAIIEAQSTLRSMVERVKPQFAGELKAINSGWANYMRPQRAAASLGAEDGLFTAAQLQNAVKAMDKSRNKGAFAKGSALMQDLSEPAKNVLSQKVPNSGTTDRMLMSLATTGGLGYVSPTALTTAGLGSLMYTPMGQKAMLKLLTERPELMRSSGDLLIQNAGRIGGLGAIAAPQLLQ